MADSPTIERRTTSAEAAVADPILSDPVAFASFKQLGIDPESFAENIVSDADSIREIESSGGKNLTRFWSGNDTTARGDYQITADTLPTMFQRYLNTAFQTGQDLPEWIIKAADPQKIETKADKKKFHPQGVGWLVGPNAITDPMDLEPSNQRILFATGKNRSVRESGDDEKYRQALEQGDTKALADVYMDHWHRGTRFSEAQLNAMEPGKAKRLRNEIRAARERADDVYSQFQPRFQSYISEPVESGREPATSIMARQTEQEYATPDLTTSINAGMLSGITDLPSRRSGSEILSEQQAISSRVDPTLPPLPPRGQAEPRLESELAATQMAAQNGRFSGVSAPQRGQIPIPQPRQPAPAPEPPLRPESEPRLESELAAIQMGAMRSDPKPPQDPQLEEVVPTQRGQAEPRLESELAATQMATQNGRFSEVNVTTPRVDETLPRIPEVSQVANVPATSLGDLEIDDNLTAHQSYERKELPAAKEDIREQLLASMPEPETREDRLDAIRDSLPDPYIPEGYEPTSSAARQIRRGVDTIAMGASLGAYDEIAGFLAEAGINGADGSYEETVNRIRQNVADQRAVSPRIALLQELGGGLFTAGGITRGLINQGVGAGKAGFAEGAFTGLAYGDTPDERLGGALGLGAVGGTLGGAIGWATNRSRKLDRATVEGARIPDDDVLDDEIARLSEKAMREAEEAGQYDWVRAGPGGLYQQKQFSYLEEAPYQASNRTQRPQVLRPKLDKDGNPSIMPSGKAEWEMQDLTWRNAKTAGQFFDGVKFGMRNFYDQKLTPASDYVMREVAPRVGAIFQRYSESALRNNTMAFKTLMEPMEKLIKSMDEDKVLKAMMMDYTNMKNLQRWNREVAEVRAAPNVQLKGPGEQTITTLEDLLDYIRKNYGDEQVESFRRYLEWNKAIKDDHVQRLSGVDAFLDDVAHHIHTRKKRKNPDEEPKDILEELARYKDDAREARTRLSMVDDLRNGQPVDKVDQYFNPLLTDFRRTSNYEVLNQMSRLFNLKKPGRGQDVQPTDLFDELYRTLITRGIAPQQAKKAITAMKDDFVGQSKTPNNWLQFFNSWGYAGSLAGPKSALLNFHDVPMAAVIYGPDSFKGLFKKMGYKVEDRGIVQRVGEFQNYVNEQMSLGARDLSKQLADTARKGTDVLMKYSLFGWADAVGKQKITQMIIQDAVDNVDSLGARWGFYFSRSELDQIAKQIRKHGTDVGSYTGRGKDLMEELFFAGLGQQQLISSAGRPLAWSRNPNLRFMWALRGFAMKQLALAHRNIIDNIAQGNKEAAWDYMKRYALFSAGAFGLLNEGRQWMWGDGEFTAGGVIMGMGDQIVSTASINTIGLNDYQWGKMMQEGVPITFIKSLEPLMTSVPRNNLMDVVQALDGEFKNNDSLNAGQRLLLPPSQFPLIKQWSNAVENVEEDFGIAPDPMAQFNRVYLQQEKVDG